MTTKKLLHTRAYEIEAFVEDELHFRLIGLMRDVRPDGLWGIVDTEPMTLHDMHIELVINGVTFEITEVRTAMLTHPQEQCPLILPLFQELVGTSIARGFGNKVKTLFGGPRSCTHFVALLNAMAPVAMQARWSFFHAVSNDSMSIMTTDRAKRQESVSNDSMSIMTTDQAKRQESMRAGHEANRDTCHVWASEGPMFAKINAGESIGIPVWAKHRLAERGIPPEEWVSF